MNTQESNTNRFAAILSDAFLVLYFLFALFPIIWMVLISLKQTEQLFTTQFAFSPTLDNYRAILFGDVRAAAGVVAKQEFPRYFMNSLIAASGAVIVSLLVGVPAAYALARYNFKGKEDLAFTFLSFRFAPELVVIIPLSVLYRQLGLYNTYFGIIWIYQLVTLPLLIWVLRSYFEDIHSEAVKHGQKKVGVLTCGPEPVVDEVNKLASEFTKEGVTMEFHEEIFEF